MWYNAMGFERALLFRESGLSMCQTGSIKHIAAGDIVEAWLDGAWSDEPFTVLEVIMYLV